MKSLSAVAIAFVVLMNEGVEARKRNNLRDGHFDRKGTSRAICATNSQPRTEDQPSGWTKFTQMTLDDGTMGPTLIESYWGYLEPSSKYRIQIIDSDTCDSSEPDAQDPQIENGSFTSNEKTPFGRGKFVDKVDDLPLTGEESILGAFVRLTDPAGNTLCCEI